MDGLSVLALVVAILVAVWQWRVVAELRGIREELENLHDDDERYGL